MSECLCFYRKKAFLKTSFSLSPLFAIVSKNNSSDFGVQGSNFGVQGSDFGVQGSDFGVQGSNFGV
jgi:hypothetical protein